jgi:hypothetical protein
VATVYDYFQRALRREPAALAIDPVVMEQHSAAFDLQVRTRDIIDRADYRCTSCVTLMALCQHASELLRGRRLSDAAALIADDLLALHPEIPALHRSRAELVVRAIQQAMNQLRRNTP